MAAPSRTLKLSILGDVDDLLKNLKKGENATDDYTKTLANFGKKAAVAFAVVGAAAGAFAISAVKGASDLAETVSKVGVLFGDTAKDIEKFAAGAAKSLGQTKQQALDAAATFATFGKAAGLSGQDLSKFSTSFVTLASDLASFNNTSPEQAINAIGSALRGEAEPLRAYGVLLNDASLKQAALSLGIIKTTNEALTPQQKVLAAQKLIFEQTSAAQGDFTRTSDGLANQTKIVTAQLENMKTEIGTALLPIVLQLATAFSTYVIPNLQAFVAGMTGKGGVTEATEDGTLGAYNFGKMVEKVIKTVYNLRGVLIAMAAVIAGVFVVSKVAAGVTATIILIQSLIKAYNALKASALVAGVALAFAMNPLLGVGAVALAASVLAGANALANKDNAATQNLGVPSNIVTEYGAYVPPEFKIQPNNIPDIMGDLPKPGSSTRSASGEIIGAGSAEQLQTRLEGIQKEMSELVFRMSTGGISTTAAQAEIDQLKAEMKVLTKQSEALQKQSQINITVNGAIDPEGTARTIVDTLNNSTYRGGGGGAGSLVMP
jgi:hypothetical protein